MALIIHFFSYILFLYCSYNVWRLTHTVEIFVSDCLSSSYVIQNTNIWRSHGQA